LLLAQRLNLNKTRKEYRMGKVVIFVLGLVLGVIGGALIGGTLIGGAATGLGAATGISAGICSTVRAAEEEGLLTPEQVDQVLTRAAADMSDMATTDGIVGGAADCEMFMQKFLETAD
jgi:hypothetical protein